MLLSCFASPDALPAKGLAGSQLLCVQAEEALASYKEAVWLSPPFAEVHCNPGMRHKGNGLFRA